MSCSPADGSVFAFTEPPIPEPLAGEVARAVYAELREEFLPEILAGRHAEHALFTIGTAHVGGRLAACCWTGAGRRRPEIGVMAGVVTLLEHRGKGIATHLVREACDRFDRNGGRHLFLGVSNPVARRIYEKLGFRNVVGQVLMRGEDLEQGGGVTTSELISRPATPGDIGGVVPLYLQPHPAVLLDAGIRMPSPRVVPPWRCVRIFWDSWNSVRDGGRWSVLADESGRLAGSAIARPSALGFSVDFFWSPLYSTAGREFAAGFIAGLSAPCEMLIPVSDDWKQTEGRLLGFRPVAGPEEKIEIQSRVFRLTWHRQT